jgi:ABC-type transport system substrate-binding protein/DNA-binding SARP family transcriptional activator
VLVDGRRVELSSRRERALLGALLLQVGEVAPVEGLIDSVWGDPAPATARHMVHVYVSRLRPLLGGAAVIATRAAGYEIEGEALELDAARFAVLLRGARASVGVGKLEEALAVFDQALGLWRGHALADVALEGDARSAAARLDNERRAARSERFDLLLALGRHSELVPELERAAASEPFDEHLLSQLMLALYRSGRQADALARYREGRETLVRELGIDPGAELRALEQAMLRQDPKLKLSTPEPAGRRTASRRPRRRRHRLAAIVAISAAAGIVVAAVLERAHGTPAASVRGNAVAEVDAATSRLLGSIPLDSPPAAITTGAGSVWVSYANSRAVARISPASMRITGSITLDTPAQGLAAARQTIWAVGSNAKQNFLTLDRIDPTFDTVTRVRRLPMMAYGDSGSLASGRGAIVVAPRSGFLTVVDPRTARVLHRVDPHAVPTAVAQGFGSTWLVYQEADAVIRVDATGATTAIPVGHRPSSIAVGKHAVWVTDAFDDTVKSIDPATSSVLNTYHVGAAPTGIAAGAGGIWVANAGDGTLTRIDERTGKPSAPLPIGASPQALAVADGKVWVTMQTPAPAQPSGGTLVVAVPSDIRQFDPAVADAIDDGPIEYAICSALLNYPEEPGPAGLQPVPDAAAAPPRVSDDGRLYTFSIRTGVRFSPPSNRLVTAATFKYTIERSLSPDVSLDRGPTPGAQELTDVVGEAAYIAGKAKHVTGITARGDQLTIRLTRRTPDLPARLAGGSFCAVPTDMPLAPLTGQPFPSAGPYYIAAATPTRLVLLRNPNYHGDRPRRPSRIVVLVGTSRPAIQEVEASKVDYAIDGVPAGQSGRLERLYGVHSPAAQHGRQRHFVNPELEVDTIDLNSSQPLFASARMRRAASYAIDRRALAAAGGAYYAHATVTEMYLPPGVAGFRDDHVYPLVPDLAKARRLAGRGRRTALLICLLQGGGPQAAQIITKNLAAIGIDVRTTCLPGPEFWPRILETNAPWDLAVEGSEGSNNPAEYLENLTKRDGTNVSHLHDPRVDALLAAAARQSGLARAFAYARADRILVRDFVPYLAYANESEHDFFSTRIGCQRYAPIEGMDLGSLCIHTPHRPADTSHSIP